MPNDFRFEPLAPGRAYTGTTDVTVSQNRVNIDRKIYEGMGAPPRIILSYDVRAKALKLEPRVNEGRGSLKVMLVSSLRVGISAQHIEQMVPKGRYLPIGSNIFIHESVQR